LLDRLHGGLNMRQFLLALLFCLSASAQTFVQAAANDNATAATTIAATLPNPTTTGNCKIVYTSIDTTCSNAAAGGTYAVTDSGSNTYNPIVPNGTGYVIGTKMTTPGTGYNSVPTVTASGCSSAGTLSASTSGTSPNITVSTVIITVPPSGCGPALPTIVFSGGTPITGNTAAAVVTAVGVQATQCSASFYSPNITGSSSDVTTFTHPSFAFHGLVVAEMGAVTTTPFDAEADAETTSSMSSVTTGAYTTAQASEIAFIGSALVNTALTWAPPSGWFTAASTSSAANHYGITMAYKIFSSVQPGATQVSSVASKSAAFDSILATFKASAVTGRRRIIVTQ
jgi:hypothetical protein